MKSFAVSLFLLPLILILSSCCDESVNGNELLFDCSYAQLGTKEAQSQPYTIMNYSSSGIIFPDADSIDQLVLSIFIIDSSLTQSVPYEIISVSCEIKDVNDELIYQGNSAPLINQGRCDEVYHLWNGFANEIPYYGVFFVNLEIEMDQGQYIKYHNINIISISCEDYLICRQFPERCSIADCRYGKYISNSQCPWEPSTLNLCE